MLRRPRPRPPLAAVLAAALLAAGCGGSGGPGVAPSFAGASLTIQARALAFDPDIATMPAGQPLRLVLDNRDQGLGHNLHVFQGATDIAQSATVVGPGVTTVELGQLPPGRYQFNCTIHPDMIGTVIVQAGAVAGPSSSDDVPPSDPPAATDSPGPSDPAAGSDAPSGP